MRRCCVELEYIVVLGRVVFSEDSVYVLEETGLSEHTLNVDRSMEYLTYYSKVSKTLCERSSRASFTSLSFQRLVKVGNRRVGIGS